MALCSLCQRIKDIRIEQGREYYQDLCENCKREELVKIFVRMGKKAGKSILSQKKAKV